MASSLAAAISVTAALSCCLPLGPFLLAAGFAGASGFFLSLQPYLIAFAVLILAFGFVQAFRARKCGRRRRIFNAAVLLGSTGLVVSAILYSFAPAAAPAGQQSVAALDLASFRESFNAAAGRTRVVVLLSPT